MKRLYFGGTILTMDDKETAQAVLTENGVIAAAGPEAELRAMAGTCEETDLMGRTMMPAFIDPHSHFFQVALSLLQVSVNGAKTADEIGERIAGFIEKNQIQPGEWIIARDYDNNDMPELRNPALEQLDSFAPENPMVIHFKSGHMGLMNSAALKKLGITEETVAPEGGKIEKAEGKLTGYLEENAFFESIKKIPMPGLEQMLKAFEQAQDKYASYGIAAVQDGMVTEEMLPVYEILLEKELLHMDVFLYASVEAYDKVKKLLAQYPENRHLKLGGLKIFLDGSPQGRTAWMRRPYEGEEEYAGYPTMTDEAVRAAFERAARENAQIICHCNGDAAAEQFLRCLKLEEEKFPNLKNLRPVLIHGQLIGADQVPRAKDLGAAISFFVAHVYHWGDVHIRNFGMQRAAHISPAADAAKAGVPFTFHQDSPVIEPDMLETVWCASNRKTASGVILGPEEKISILQALRAVTATAAWQYSEEAQRGTLSAGKTADFTVLDRNPLETAPEEIRDIRVLGTCIAGQWKKF